MNLKLTQKAKEEIHKLEADEITSINFSKMRVGSGPYTTEELETEITVLKEPQMETDIADPYQETIDGESQLFISSTLFNGEVETKFEVREVGIYALSSTDSNEYLYAYYIIAKTDLAIAIMQDKSIPQYLPISVNTKISNIDQVNIVTINDMLVVNQDEFKRYKVDIKKHIDDEDISIRTHLDEEDAKIKASIVEQNTTIRTYVDEQDTTLKTYIDAEDTKIKNLANTKANSNHGHGLADGNISGVLPTSKGGTGRTDGGAKAYVYSNTSNPTYLLGTDSSSSYPTLYRVSESYYVRGIDQSRRVKYNKDAINYAPADGWIRAQMNGPADSRLWIQYIGQDRGLMAKAHIGVWSDVTVMIPIRSGQAFQVKHGFDLYFYYDV